MHHSPDSSSTQSCPCFGGTHLNGDAGDGSFWMGREHMTGGAQRGNGRTAAEADEVLEKGISAQADGLGDVAVVPGVTTGAAKLSAATAQKDAESDWAAERRAASAGSPAAER